MHGVGIVMRTLGTKVIAMSSERKLMHLEVLAIDLEH